VYPADDCDHITSGDLHGDGLSDLLIGPSWSDDFATVVYGEVGLSLADAGVHIPALYAYGRVPKVLPDVPGDGFDDALWAYDDGLLYVLEGSSSGLVPDWAPSDPGVHALVWPDHFFEGGLPQLGTAVLDGDQDGVLDLLPPIRARTRTRARPTPTPTPPQPRRTRVERWGAAEGAAARAAILADVPMRGSGRCLRGGRLVRERAGRAASMTP